jgi:hypothetical protein
MSTSWIAVASAEHVRIGRARGFMQVCHGKAAPLRRLSPGDRVIYYSPTETFRGKDRLQAFTAIGIVAPGAPHQADMGGASVRFAGTCCGARRSRRRCGLCSADCRLRATTGVGATSSGSACFVSRTKIYRSSRPRCGRRCDLSVWRQRWDAEIASLAPEARRGRGVYGRDRDKRRLRAPVDPAARALQGAADLGLKGREALVGEARGVGLPDGLGATPDLLRDLAGRLSNLVCTGHRDFLTS